MSCSTSWIKSWSTGGTGSRAMCRRLQRVRAVEGCGRAGEGIPGAVPLGTAPGLRVNRDKSAVARPWRRKFLGYTVTPQREPKLKVAPQSVHRLKAKLRVLLRKGRG